MYDDSEQINPRQRMRFDKLSPSSARNLKLEAMARILILDRASRGYNPLKPEANLQAAGQKLKGANAKFRKIPEITERIRAISERS